MLKTTCSEKCSASAIRSFKILINFTVIPGAPSCDIGKRRMENAGKPKLGTRMSFTARNCCAIFYVCFVIACTEC